MAYVLAQVSTPDEWKKYHSIRRTILFASRDYDEDHADEFLPNHLPFLLKINDNGVATVRLDLKENASAVIRLVAVTKEEQGKGHGGMLYALLEKEALKQGVNKLLVNAAPEALGYYKKLGFYEEIWDADELQGVAEDCIQMCKKIAP